MVPDLAPFALLLAAGAFAAGGSVKGAFGFGLPLVTVPLLAMVMPPPTAIALMLVPVISANIVQAFQGGYYRSALRRFWPFFITMTVATLIAVQFLATFDPKITSIVLGGIIILFSLYQLWSPTFDVSRRAEIFLTPLVGVIAGLIGGVTGLFGLPLVVYLVSLRLPKDEFVGTVSFWNLFGSLPLFGGLAWHGILTLPIAGASGGGALISILGVWAGTWARGYLPQAIFRRILLAILVVVGANLIRRSVM
jgi:uncharacterized membrane protein YfcA